MLPDFFSELLTERDKLSYSTCCETEGTLFLERWPKFKYLNSSSSLCAALPKEWGWDSRQHRVTQQAPDKPFCILCFPCTNERVMIRCYNTHVQGCALLVTTEGLTRFTGNNLTSPYQKSEFLISTMGPSFSLYLVDLQTLMLVQVQH